MRRSKSVRLTLLPWLASVALAQAPAACAEEPLRAPPDTPSFRDPDCCDADAGDDDCFGRAQSGASSEPEDAPVFHPTTDDDDSVVLGSSPVPVYRGGFGGYFWAGGG